MNIHKFISPGFVSRLFMFFSIILFSLPFSSIQVNAQTQATKTATHFDFHPHIFNRSVNHAKTVKVIKSGNPYPMRVQSKGSGNTQPPKVVKNGKGQGEPLLLQPMM